jgi:hypothetical protein
MKLSHQSSRHFFNDETRPAVSNPIVGLSYYHCFGEWRECSATWAQALMQQLKRPKLHSRDIALSWATTHSCQRHLPKHQNEINDNTETVRVARASGISGRRNSAYRNG